MDLDTMSVQHLRALASARGIKANFKIKKAELLQMLKDQEVAAPVDIYKDEITNKTIVEFAEPEKEPDRIAVYASGRVLLQGIGIFDKGYHILPSSARPIVEKSHRVRIVTAKEVAEYYGSFKN